MKHLCNDKCQETDQCEKEYDNWFCTLPKGHEGHHIACGTNNHDLCVWDDTHAWEKQVKKIYPECEFRVKEII